MILWISFATTVCAIFNGMFGMVGGALLLAILFSLDFEPKTAIPLHGIVMLFSYSSTISMLYRYISFPHVAVFIGASLPTMLLAPLLMAHIDRHVAQMIISIIIVYMTWAPERIRIKNPLTTIWSNMALAGLVGGATSITIGVAGTFVSPLYLRKEWDNHTVLATKSACMIYLQLFKIASFSLLGFNPMNHADLLLPMCLTVILGNLVGVFLVGKISMTKYRFLYKSALTAAVIFLWADILVDSYGKK